MKNDDINPERFAQLVRGLLCSTDEASMAGLLRDLCTPAEIEAMADRLHVLPFVASGHSYRHIHALTGVSLTTIGRVARHWRQGSGGYIQLLKQVPRWHAEQGL